MLFKLIGMANFMTLSELIVQIRREGLKAGDMPSKALRFRILLVDILL